MTDSVSESEFFLRSAVPLRDPEIEAFKAQKLVSHLGVAIGGGREESVMREFVRAFLEWHGGGAGRSGITGLSSWTAQVTNATTDSFHGFYLRHRARRLRLFRGEYPYHRDFATGAGWSWSWLDEPGGAFAAESLSAADCVILSLPFSGSGSSSTTHLARVHQLLRQCDQLQVPVMLDFAFWGLSQPFEFDVTAWPAIETLCFSFSKIFRLGAFRIGLEFSRQRTLPNAILNDWQYVNLIGAAAATALMREFSVDHVWRNYRAVQVAICQEHGLMLSDTLMFGLGDERFQASFARDGVVNRVCLTPLLESRGPT